MVFCKIRCLSQKIQNKIQFWIGLLSLFAAILFTGAAIIDYGFVLDAHEMFYINKIYHFVWTFYVIVFTLRIILNILHISHESVILLIFLGLGLYLSILPHCITLSPDSALAGVWNFLGNKYFIIALLAIFSLIDLSRGIVNFISKKTNPALLLAASFAIIIFLGALLLLLPRSTLPDLSISVVDALFVSTSAVCVTGLTPVDVSATFSLEGQIVIALLIQIGGLGVMTITSFFALFFMGETKLYSQFALRDMVSSGTFNSLLLTLLYIISFTFVIESVGAFCLWFNIHGTMGMSLPQEIFFSIFHSISAFCNAGFSTLNGNLGNPLLMSGHQGVYITISLLVILGGIGFPLLVNLRNLLLYRIKFVLHKITGRKHPLERYTHLTNINTKMVLGTTIALLIIGTALLALLEWNNAFASMSVADKLVHSFFNAVVPRTAGFNSVETQHFSLVSLLIIIMLMWIGGGSQSTAGGIKVNTFALACANFMSIIRRRDKINLYNREISFQSIRRASATIFGSLLLIAGFFIALVIVQPNINPFKLFFETVSAFGTVGSSLNVTPLLGGPAKLILTVLMFVGRVGFITVLMSFIRLKREVKYRFPKDNVIIN